MFIQRQRRMTNRLTIARYVSMSVCLCAFTFLPVPHLLGLSWVEAAEAESPCQKDREFSEKELAGDASARRQLNNRRHTSLDRPREVVDPWYGNAGSARRPRAIVGHQLANGLRAPLLT